MVAIEYSNYKDLKAGGGQHVLPDITSTGAQVVTAAFVDAGVYTRNIAHQDYVDLSGIVAEMAVSSPTWTAFVFDHSDTTFVSVSGASFEEIVYYFDDNGATPTSPLLFNFDGYNVTPNGGNIDLQTNVSGVATW